MKPFSLLPTVFGEFFLKQNKKILMPSFAPSPFPAETEHSPKCLMAQVTSAQYTEH